MTRHVLVLTFDPAAPRAEVDAWLERARAVRHLPGVRTSDAGLDLPDSFGGGDATWDLDADLALEEVPSFTRLTSVGRGPLQACRRVTLDPVAAGDDPFEGPRIKRTLLLAVDADTPADVVRQFELSMAAMAEHVTEIRSWCLSRVSGTTSAPRWTHAWEQEFADLDGLRRGYLRAPYHLTAVDRWFDREIPGAVVDEGSVAHLVRPAPGRVLQEMTTTTGAG